MKSIRYQMERQRFILDSLDRRVTSCVNNVISISVFHDMDVMLVREYMRERYPSISFNIKRVEP